MAKTKKSPASRDLLIESAEIDSLRAQVDELVPNISSEDPRRSEYLTQGELHGEGKGLYGKTLRSIVRAEWEAGETMRVLSKRHGMTARTIERWRHRYKWDRDSTDAASAILQFARAEIRRKVELQKVEVETNLSDILIRHKAASATLMDMLGEAMTRAMAYPHKDPFRQMLIIKVATEVARNVQLMDRKTYRLDDGAGTTKTTTAIFEVLDRVEDAVVVAPGGDFPDGS